MKNSHGPCYAYQIEATPRRERVELKDGENPPAFFRGLPLDGYEVVRGRVVAIYEEDWRT